MRCPNGDAADITATAPKYRMRTCVTAAFALHDPKLRIELASLAAEQRNMVETDRSGRCRCARTILCDATRSGACPRSAAAGDHFDFQADPFSKCVADRILITEKDAVKCADNLSLATDPRCGSFPWLPR